MIPLFQIPAIASHFPRVHLCYTLCLLTGLLPSLLTETQALYKAFVVTMLITLEYCMFFNDIYAKHMSESESTWHLFCW